MSPELRSWMRPDDLVLYQLDLLPWPAYTLLVERFYEANDFRVKLIVSEPGRSEYLLVSKTGVRYILHCCSVAAASRPSVLARLRSVMCRFHVDAAILASPKDFPASIIDVAREASVDLLSGNRLRAKIEMMPAEKRRAVLDSIRPKREMDAGERG